MSEDRTFNVNGEVITLLQVRERNDLVRQAKEYGRETYGCCGAMANWELKIVRATYSELLEIIRQIKFAKQQIEAANSMNQASKRGLSGDQQP